MRAWGRTLAALASSGASSFYEGAFGRELSELAGGLVAEDDLRSFRPAWQTPLTRHVFGLDVWTLPPSSQGYITLAAASILERCGAPDDPEDPRQWHLMIESLKVAAHDRDTVLSDDPERVPLALEDIDRRASQVGDRASPLATLQDDGDTVFLCAVDRCGMGVSLIQSLYHPWGSRCFLPASGVMLQNRGSSFSLDDTNPNVYHPGLRARTTLAPTVLSQDGSLYGLLGTMGGDVQPQTNLQNLVRHRWGGLDPAETLNFPRFYLNRGLAPTIWTGPEPTLGLESRTPPSIVADLRRRGHNVQVGAAYSEGAGHAQIILRTTEGLVGAADPRSGSEGVASD